ncbi:hypothetical protein [Nocardiopsis lucentensis]|uniref:hypothetical protein n=1 Tax=Nocardiopsis lucentensis TaxID=53441 RepID=UPI0003472281|nr:hypothetical protein [Nocardiopsis lucentensis]
MNASLSTMWERVDQDHDFGGTNRELRCREHWGLEAPPVIRSRKSRSVPSGANRSKRARSQTKAKKKPQVKRSGAVKKVDMAELNRMCRRAKELLPQEPDKAAEICARALRLEREVVSQEGRKGRVLMDVFLVFQRQALSALRPSPGRSQSSRSGAVPAPRRPSQRRSGVGDQRQSSGKRRNRGKLGSAEERELRGMYREAKGLVTRDPGRAVRVCDQALSALEGRSGCATLRDLLRQVRGEALRKRRGR